ncbi:hypothetical protein Tco_0874670 [Tanacetum coccineum]|uniref:Uncharacterized protein n=1 Tax=Tanacetum coccineum TaxID=301880 RepID=A0ABQ5BNZ3_9ASTR
MEASTSKPMSSFRDYVFGKPGESDEDEVYEPDDISASYISSFGGGQQLEEDELDFSDGYETRVYGGDARISALHKLFPLMVDKKNLASDKERTIAKGKASLLVDVDYYVKIGKDT